MPHNPRFGAQMWSTNVPKLMKTIYKNVSMIFFNKICIQSMGFWNKFETIESKYDVARTKKTYFGPPKWPQIMFSYTMSLEHFQTNGIC